MQGSGLMSKNDEHVFPVDEIRKDFPILSTQVHGKPLVYLDNAASSQKPTVVIDAIKSYYETINANVHRGIHALSDQATRAYEGTREIVRRNINAESTDQIIFTKGTTDSLNLLAHGFGRKFLNAGDNMIISAIEHHSNIVPWQMLAEEIGFEIRVIPINDNAQIDLNAYAKMLDDKTKLVSIVHTSNSLGVINQVDEVILMAKQKNIPVALDGAQALPHGGVDVQELDCDFLAFSAHKLCGPTGTGVLYGKRKWLEEMRPYQGGGDMISTVSFEKTTYNDLPYKFEAGTPNIAGVVGMGKAFEYLENIGFDKISKHEQELLHYTQDKMREMDGVKIYGDVEHKASVISFLVDGVHPSDIGTLLDVEGVAVRTGHHCTQPVMDRFEIPGTVRASFSFYNNKEDADRFLEALKKAIAMFR